MVGSGIIVTPDTAGNVGKGPLISNWKLIVWSMFCDNGQNGKDTV